MVLRKPARDDVSHAILNPWQECEIVTFDTRTEFFQGVIEHPPVYPSYTTPVYSNIAFAILALAYEEITKVPFEEGFSRVYNQKLGLSSTTPSQPPKDANAIIPRNESFSLFSYDLGLEAP
jgi:CubicO group peptidase (beta-lactamase class C family)